MCFGRMLKICDVKYNGEDWKRVELVIGASWFYLAYCLSVCSTSNGLVSGTFFEGA